MKIISKFKDFYDFNVAKYGVDPILIFDRRARADLPAPKQLPDRIKIAGKGFDAKRSFCPKMKKYPKGSLKKANRFACCQTLFYRIDWLSGCLTKTSAKQKSHPSGQLHPTKLTHTSTSAQYRQNAYPRKHTSPRAVSAWHRAENASKPSCWWHETKKATRPPWQNTHPRV